MSFQSADTITTAEYHFTKTITVTASSCAQDVSNTQTGIILYRSTSHTIIGTAISVLYYRVL